MIKNLLGLAAKETEDGSYQPSPMSLKMAAPDKTDYSPLDVKASAPASKNKILMVCTEEKHLRTTNDKKFSTGNHPVEMLVPVLHLENAGYEIEVFTPNGRPACVEKWALPEKDDRVMKAWDRWEDRLKNPGSLKEFVNGPVKAATEYSAVFFPGGHGALLGLPVSEPVGQLIHWAVENDLYILAICHGPAALLAAEKTGEFPFSGYKMAAFPDSADKKLPWVGYLPGKLPWYFNEKLEALGMTVVNKMPDDSCHADRRLITGASPQAADAFGKLAVETMSVV